MYIKNLKLVNFRNYDMLDLDFNSNINILTGDNAQGKTNILESIYYCSLGKSHRTSKDKELIQWNKEEAYVSLYVCKNRLDKKIEIKIFKGGKKGININSIKLKKISELFGIFNVVMFAPEDLKIVKDSPSYRRRFLDIELSRLNSKYYYNLVQYHKVLDQRNISLKSNKLSQSGIIDVYDEQLSRLGAYLIERRFNYIKELNLRGSLIHSEITDSREKIKFSYLTSINHIENAKNELYEAFSANRKKDIEKGNTSVGPHRDDFDIKINEIDTRSFGSQGQQRTAILTIKFASIEIIKNLTGELPVLLLDDVLSELDTKRQKYILNSLEGLQTFITCTGIEDVKSYIKKDFEIFKVSNGKIINDSNKS